MKIGNLEAKVGTKIQGFIKVYDIDKEMPVTLISGAEEGETILITAGIHGAEYPCIKTAIDIAKEIDPKCVKGNIIIVHPVNLSGFKERCAAIVPEDGKNLNRVFPGDKEGSVAEKIAHFITYEMQEKANYYIDLHGGDLHEDLVPYVYYAGVAKDEVVKESKRIAECVNVKYMVKSKATTGAYNSAALRGTPSILIERGGCGLCKEEHVRAYKKDVINILSSLGFLNNEIKIIDPSLELENIKYIDANIEGCLNNYVKAGDFVEKGQLLCEITDYFGNVTDKYYAEFPGIVLYNTISYAIKKDSSLICYAEVDTGLN